jgi:hypothetical protein
MMLSCPDCDSIDVELVDDNGVTKPPATRVEFYECHGCSGEFRKVLTV